MIKDVIGPDVNTSLFTFDMKKDGVTLAKYHPT